MIEKIKIKIVIAVPTGLGSNSAITRKEEHQTGLSIKLTLPIYLYMIKGVNIFVEYISVKDN